MSYIRAKRRINIESFSDFFRKRLKPGEENQFFSNKNGIVIDTSFIVGFFYESKLWTLNALLETYLLEPYFLILLPGVVNELRGLEIGNKLDKYGNPLIARGILNDLRAGDMKLQIELPEEFDSRIVNMWKSVSRKYRSYLEKRNKNPEEYVEEPVISRTDIEVIKYALARADKGLTSCVLSGDSDITDTAEGFGHQLPIFSIGPYKPPHHELLAALFEKVVLIDEKVLGDTRKVASGNYVMFGQLRDKSNSLNVDIGFRVTDKPVKNEEVYSVPVISVEDMGNVNLLGLLKEHRYVLIKEDENSLPGLLKSSNFIVSRGKLIDPLHKYKDVTINEYLETSFGIDRHDKTLSGHYQAVQKLRMIPLIRSVAYVTVEDWYLQTYTPQLFDALFHLRASI